MIGKVQQDSFQSLRIRIDAGNDIEFDPIRSGFSSPVGSVGDSLLLGRDCQEPGARMRQLSGYQTSNSSSQNNTTSLNSPNNSQQQQTQSSSRYKTEMCRPFQENGVCKYGEKCQFAHGHQELRTISRHPKYKTDMCRTYHSVGFCPYGPRCHFIHSLDELRPMPTTPEKKSPGVVKQLPMFGGGFSGGNNNSSQSANNTSWNFPDNFSSDMKSAVHQLNNYFNVSNNGNTNNGGNNSNNVGNPSGVTAASRTGFNSAGSSDSSRSGSFCSDIDSLSSHSPPPYSPDKASRLPIFSRLA